MDRRTPGFDWGLARALLATAQTGSFSAAARALGLAQPTVGRQVSALERELGVVVFERVGRGVQLTPVGGEIVEQVRAMAEAADRVALIAEGRSLSLEGPVCISASQIEAAFQLPAIAQRIRAEHPGILLEIVSTNQVSDLIRREADIAIRSFRPKEPDLIARKVRTGRARLYAARSYLDRIGWPQTPAELSQASFIGFSREEPALMNWLNQAGLSLTEASFPVVSQDQLVQWELVKRGVGIAIMVEEIAEAEPLVAPALASFPAFPLETWVTTHRELSTNRRMRVVFDLLVEELGA